MGKQKTTSVTRGFARNYRREFAKRARSAAAPFAESPEPSVCRSQCAALHGLLNYMASQSIEWQMS